MNKKKIRCYKRDFFKRAYEEIELERDTVLYTDDLDREIECINCWKKIKYGDSYTSKQYHTKFWLWYLVCSSCYQRELLLKNEAQNKK